MTKLVVIALMIAIIASLGSGLIHLVRDQGETDRTVRALSWRIGLSLLLIGLLVVGYFLGIVEPHNFGQ